MELFYKLRGYLDGYKTYLAGAGLVLTGLANQDYQAVLEGLSVIFLRAGIKKV